MKLHSRASFGGIRAVRSWRRLRAVRLRLQRGAVESVWIEVRNAADDRVLRMHLWASYGDYGLREELGQTANWEVRMSKTSLVVAIVAVVGLAIPTHAQLAPAPAAVDYDTFMQQDVEGRLRVFNQVTPENRAELVRTQIIRWVEGNRARLTAEQLKVMDENLAYVTPDRYRQPMNQEQRAQAKEMEARTTAVFSREQMMQALTVYSTYIPKKQ